MLSRSQITEPRKKLEGRKHCVGKINQDLLLRIATKLGVEVKAVYGHIAKTVAETHLERPVAALYLARSLGISINKYSSASERAELRMVSTAAVERRVVTSTAAQEASTKPKQSRKPQKKPESSVFVVHGRDSDLTKSTYEFIRALGLTVLEWNHALKTASKGNANPYISDILEKVMEKAGAVVILLSPDDEVKLSDRLVSPNERKTEGKLQGQARPNVLFEAGLALGAHPKKTILVQIGQIKPFSDIGGMHTLRMSNSNSARNSFANKLENVLGKVDKTGDTWLSAGNFSSATAKKAARK
jgi:predicted nucleotide-binding protein